MHVFKALESWQPFCDSGFSHPECLHVDIGPAGTEEGKEFTERPRQTSCDYTHAADSDHVIPNDTNEIPTGLKTFCAKELPVGRPAAVLVMSHEASVGSARGSWRSHARKILGPTAIPSGGDSEVAHKQQGRSTGSSARRSWRSHTRKILNDTAIASDDESEVTHKQVSGDAGAVCLAKMLGTDAGKHPAQNSAEKLLLNKSCFHEQLSTDAGKHPAEWQNPAFASNSADDVDEWPLFAFAGQPEGAQTQHDLLGISSSDTAPVACQTEASVKVAEAPLQQQEQHEKKELACGEGRIHVLICFGTAESDSESCSDASLSRVELWCHLCSITDVQTLDVASASEETLDRTLRHGLLALGARCSPGDICVLFVARLPDMAGRRSDADATTWQARKELSLRRQFFTSSLPPRVTVVCISDAAHTIEHVGLDEKLLCESQNANFRAIVMLVSFSRCRSSSLVSATRRHALFVDALMQTSHALSLLDGPRGLTCLHLFEELSDQATDLASASGMTAPHLSLHAYPKTELANSTRWPVAKAVPLNGACSPSSPRKPQTSSLQPESDRRQPNYANISKTLAYTEAAECRAPQFKDGAPSLTSFFSLQQDSVKESVGTTTKRKKSRSTSNKNRPSGRNNSGNKAPGRANSQAPGGIDQFAAMFSGGLLDNAGHKS